ncbi:hypothetical protein LCGC14_1641120 [marine sediment metagenome]|uniref:Uncharacterized protein n=1 Tax=marine sediment metagenome TaxID=412755 RepID=A0A0F9IM17_9ZZZZ
MARHGLLTQQPGGAPAEAPAPARGAPTPQQGGGEEQPNVSPEEQAQYDQFVDNAFSVIYDDKSLPQIIESLKGDGNPVDGLANTAVTVVVRVQDSAEKAGQALPPDVVFHAGTEILEDLAELAAKAGVHEFTPEEVEGAAFQAMDIYREMKGRDGGAERPQIVEDFNQIVALDQAGKIDEVAPGLTERFGGGAQAAGAR